MAHGRLPRRHPFKTAVASRECDAERYEVGCNHVSAWIASAAAEMLDELMPDMIVTTATQCSIFDFVGSRSLRSFKLTTIIVFAA